MIKEITYYADDGTIFDNERDCIIYENGLKKIFENLYSWDSNLFIIDKVQELESRSFYIFIKNTEILQELSEEFYVLKTIPQENGFWIYNMKKSEWEKAEKTLHDLNEEIHKIKNFMTAAKNTLEKSR